MSEWGPYVVVGLDLSLTGTGICIIGHTMNEQHLIRSKGKAGASLHERAGRLRLLTQKICDLVPDDALVVVEQPAYSQTGGSHHDRSGLWWLVVDWIAEQGFWVAEVTPGGVKKYATGKGNASKDQVLAAVIKRYPDLEIEDNNIADATVLAAMGRRWLGFEAEDSLPLANLTAMAAVRWPGATS